MMASSISTLRAPFNALDGIAGRVVTPGDPAYDTTRAVFYGDVDKHPAPVVRGATAADVRRSVDLARTHGSELAIRSGGHSIAGHSSTEGGLVIDLREMASI